MTSTPRPGPATSPLPASPLPATSPPAGPHPAPPADPIRAPQLPAALAPWSTHLSVLTPDVAVALGPLVLRLHDLLTTTTPAFDGDGPLDGYDGISHRGSPEHLLASQWLLATELPMEFWRRATSNELLHLAPARPRRRSPGMVAVLADTGLDQLGAGRLVQLATLLVLHRRAADRGVDLALGILGETPGRWHTGPLPSLLDVWLAARRPDTPSPERVEAWRATTEDPTELWLLSSPGLGASWPDRRHRVTSEVSAWNGEGACAVRVAVGDASAELPLPPAAAAVRVLRGSGFASRDIWAVSGRLRHPSWPSRRQRLLARGARPNELVWVAVPQRAGAVSRTPVRRQPFGGTNFGATVLAAGWLNRKTLVVLSAPQPNPDHLVVEWVGKGAGSHAPIKVEGELADLPLDEAALAELNEGPVAELYSATEPYDPYGPQELLAPLGPNGTWWGLSNGQPSRRLPDVATVAPSPRGPRLARQTPDGLRVHEPDGSGLDLDEAYDVVLGDGVYAWHDGSGRWCVEWPSGVPHEPGFFEVNLPDDHRVLGVITLKSARGPRVTRRRQEPSTTKGPPSSRSRPGRRRP